MASPSFGQFGKQKKENATATNRQGEGEFYFTEGEKYFILEDYAKALLYYQRVAELTPSNPTVHYKIAEVLSKRDKEEDLQKAAQSIEVAISLDKKNKYFYLLGAHIYSNLGQFSKSARLLETLLKEVKGTDDYIFELAAMYLYDNKSEEAIKVYNRAEMLMGINEVSSLQKQRIFLEHGKLEEAMAEGEKLMQAFPDEERYVLGLAESLSQHGEIEKAVSYVENFLKDHPAAGSSKMMLAGLYRDSGKEKKSREYALMVIDDPNVDASSKVLMVGVYNSLIVQNQSKSIKNVDMEAFALQIFQKLEINHPQDPNVHLIGGDLYMTLQRKQDAEREYRQSIRLGSSHYEAWQNLLMLETQTDNIDSLIVNSEEALELFPNQGMFYYFNGYANLRKKKYAQSAEALEQAKKLSSTNKELVNEINTLLGDAYEGAKDYAKSEMAYDEALLFNPNNDLVLNNYSYYLAIRKQNLEKAEKMSGQLIKDHPDNASYLDTHAWVLFMREKYKDARKYIEKAITGGNPSAIHFDHYGDILYQLGEVDNAVVQWQKAKSMGISNSLIDKKIANRRIL